jgi:hypothetical protein
VRQTLLAVPLLLLVAACGTEAGPVAGRPAGGEGDQPITQAAIAAVAVDHLPGDPSSMRATDTDRQDPEGYLGADFRYDAGGEDDGDLVRVAVMPPQGGKVCRDAGAGGCERLDAPGGTELYLVWGEVEPEEDPGYVYVLLRRPHEDVAVHASGENIVRDPRRLDLRVSVAAMLDLVRDDRLHLHVTQEVVDAGEGLQGWGGGEPDPHAYDRVPSTDEAITSSYFLFHGGYLSYSQVRPSPLKGEFGPGAIGGRFHHDGDRDQPTSEVDVLAAPQGPSWLADDPCATPRFAGHCRRFPGHRGPKYLAWVPGPVAEGGEVWMFQDRGDEVVAIRSAGWDVPETEYAAGLESEWFLLRELLDDRNLGLRCDKELLDFDLEREKDAGR